MARRALLLQQLPRLWVRRISLEQALEDREPFLTLLEAQINLRQRDVGVLERRVFAEKRLEQRNRRGRLASCDEDEREVVRRVPVALAPRQRLTEVTLRLVQIARSPEQ